MSLDFDIDNIQKNDISLLNCQIDLIISKRTKYVKKIILTISHSVIKYFISYGKVRTITDKEKIKEMFEDY